MLQSSSRRAGEAKRDLAAPPRHALALQHWLCAALRFAITLNGADRAAVLALAVEMDRAGSPAGRGSFAFFVRTSVQLCEAMMAPDRPDSAATLRVFLRRIDHLPLRRAFEAVFDMKPSRPDRRDLLRRNRERLWKGLPASGARQATTGSRRDGAVADQASDTPTSGSIK